ncbi:hypothetical protein AUJ17_00110 [Candidatus Micrarchaeota archaeon CG1_02_47_40]|nr:MAG: hypothetical protein AUJ17_00110 [Candidatus Micrarchaeota archaeon CG1_02_47_40]
MKDDIICDSSAIISLTDSCLIDVFYFLAPKFAGKFLIPASVEDECVLRPMKMKSHAMSAMRIGKALRDGVLCKYSEEVQGLSEEIAFLANNSFFIGKKPLRLVHGGEAQMLAAAVRAGSKNLLMDERTTRMLCEEPHALARHLEEEFKCGVKIDFETLSKFGRIVGKPSFLRSTELLIIAYEKGYLSHFGEMERPALEASLYSLKFAGTSTSFDEIDSFLGKKGLK